MYNDFLQLSIVFFLGNGLKHHSFIFKHDRLLSHEKLHHSSHQESLSSDNIFECKWKNCNLIANIYDIKPISKNEKLELHI